MNKVVFGNKIRECDLNKSTTFRWASEEKVVVTQLYSATWETFGCTCQTENCCSHWLAQTTIHSSQYLCWLRFLIRQSDTLTVNTGVRTRNAACNERCRTPTVVGQRYIDMLLGLQPSISIRLSLTLKQLDLCQAAFIFIQYSKVPVVLQNKGSCSPIRHSASVRRTRDALLNYSDTVWYERYASLSKIL